MMVVHGNAIYRYVHKNTYVRDGYQHFLVTDSDQRGLDILALGNQEPVEVFEQEVTC